MSEQEKPVEADFVDTTAIVRYDSTARQVADFIEEQIRKQRHLPWLKRRDIIPHDDRYPLQESAVREVDSIVKALNIPYQYVAMIPQGKGRSLKPFVMADGWFLRCRADPRGIWEVKQDVQVDHATQSVIAKCTITMGSGQKFEGVQYHLLQDEPGRDSANMTRMVNRTLTQARGKAAFAAVGGQFPGVAEEYQELADSGEVKPQVTAAPTIKAQVLPANGAKLIAQAMAQFGFPMKRTMEILGVATVAEIVDIAAAWEVLKAASGSGK